MKIFDALFGCWHKNTGFPLTRKRGQHNSGSASQTGTYVVCLDCGREFAYDWKKMRIVDSAEERSFAHAQVEAKAS